MAAEPAPCDSRDATAPAPLAAPPPPEQGFVEPALPTAPFPRVSLLQHSPELRAELDFSMGGMCQGYLKPLGARCQALPCLSSLPAPLDSPTAAKLSP